MKRIIGILLAALALCGCAVQTVPDSALPASGQSAASAQTWTEAASAQIPAVTGEFRVTMLDVGKADCLILQTENHTVMVDTGLKDTSGEVLDWLADNGVEQIDVLVLSHFDKDHVGGAAEILEQVPVEQVYQADYDGDSGRYEKYQEAAAAAGVPVERVSEQTDFVLDDVLFSLRPASPELVKTSLTVRSEDDEPDENDCSLVLAAWHGEDSFAFLGDAEDNRVQELLRQNIGPFDFVKAPHHGRVHNYTLRFFEALDPAVVFITCAEDEKSAEAQLVNSLTEQGAQVCLSMDGTVSCISDGSGLRVE